MNTIFARLSAWRTHWTGLAPRERQALLLATGTLGLALAWWLLLAPALQTLRQAPSQHAALDQKLLQMQRLQAEAQRLQAHLPAPTAPGAMPLPKPDIPRSLQESVREQLGAGAQLVVQGERAQLTLQNIPAHALAAWLAQTRQNLKVNVVEMRLTAAQPSATARPDQTRSNDQQWDGSLVLGLPLAEAMQ